MADLPANSNHQEPKKELKMEHRLLIAFALMFGVLFVTPYIYKPAPAPKRQGPSPTPSQASQLAQPPEAPAIPTAKEQAPAQPVPGTMQAASEQNFVVDTSLYRIQFTNRGATVKSWVLKKFLDSSGKPLELVNTAALTKIPAPFAISLKDQQISSELNQALFIAKPAPGGLGIDYEFSDGKNYCRKSFQFGSDTYLAQITTEVTANGVPAAHSIEWRGGFGDASVLNRAGEQQSIYYDLAQSKLVVEPAKAVKDAPITAAGNYSFAGLDDRFFAFVLLPKTGNSIRIATVRDDLPSPPNGKDQQYVGVEVGGDSVNRFSMFVGPKDIDIFRRVDPRLQQLIDWGWFGVIAKPLFLALHWINDNIVHNYGWAIVLLTVLINLAVLPLRLSSLKSQKKMQALQPHIQAINAKYKGIGIRDPKKAEQNQEVMELYKKHGVNPLGGCLPMLIQLPILYAFYKVLTVTIELRGAHWLWVTDLSRPETLGIHLLPVIMIVTQYFMQKMTPNPSMDPAQARMMAFMPLMFGFLFYNAS